jgi:glycosyltransferase involved in cell wall biosynthesis
MKLSATIICKNEAAHIADCLRSLGGIDEIVLCDTGSTDGTVAVARAIRPDLVLVERPWDDHFSNARNAALDVATGDWCVVIDCDETLLPGTVQSLREAIADRPEVATFRFLCQAKGDPSKRHFMVRAHARIPGIRWEGRIHEALTGDSTVVAQGCVLEYGYSVAHNSDPDRALRLLQRDHDEAVAAGQLPTPRTLYYLAREHMYRKNFVAAIPILEQRVQTIGFRSECADALLYLATCYWLTGQGDKAREACMRSLIMAPDCKETLEFMATLSFPEQAKTWAKFSREATNEGVLFIRKI